MNTTKIYLTARECLYLMNSKFLPEPLANLISELKRGDKKDATLILSCDVAEEFRSAFTERLARVGFDKEYEPTAEGAILESLIDSFQGAHSTTAR